MSKRHEIRKIVTRFVEPWSNGHTEVFDELCAPNYKLGTTATLQDLKDGILAYRKALPDLQASVGEIIIDGDKVAYTWIMRGTHLGDYQGIRETGKQVVMKGITILHLEHGRIVHDEFESSSPSFEQQISEKALVAV